MKNFGNNKPSKRLSTSLKLLTLAMTSIIASTAVQADVNKKMIGDLEIFKTPEAGTASITMMLDTSASMLDIKPDFDQNHSYKFTDSSGKEYWRYKVVSGGQNCRYLSNADGTGEAVFDGIKKVEISIPHILDNGNKDGTEYKFVVRGCYGDGGTIEYDESTGMVNSEILDRISRLKIALVGVLADERLLANKNKIGMGNYSYNGDGASSAIRVPAKSLTTEHRKKLIDYIMSLKARGGTPTAHAYAETGAYMMGTDTWDSGFAKYTGYTQGGAGTCDGQGIYLLTDGNANNSDGNKASALMNKSLRKKDAIKHGGYEGWTCYGDLKNGKVATAWGCMGEYSKLLRAKDNLKKSPVLTATVGFGSVYTKGVTDPLNVDCNTLKNNDDEDNNAYNLCMLGSKKASYGKGGFTATSDPAILAQSVIDFLGTLNNDIAPVPSGVIVIPDDPYSAISQQAVAFYPSLEAMVANRDAIWPGNMKKYAIDEGTLYGKKGKPLFVDFVDEDEIEATTPEGQQKAKLSKVGKLNPKAQDLWSTKNYTDSGGKSVNNLVTSGGFYALLNSGSGISSQRTVYVEDWNNTTDKKPVLRLFSVDASGKVNLDGKPLSDSNNFVDTVTYTDDKVKILLGFLGFSNLPNVAPKDMKLEASNIKDPVRILGASVHSAPAFVSFSVDTDENGSIDNSAGKRDDYVLFGSMDGALHLVDADDEGTSDGGKEKFAFIPREIVKNQAEALKAGGRNSKVGTPSMGIDAPWLVVADYNFDESANQIKLDERYDRGMYAYGGMRMGGTSLYGLDLTDSRKTLDANNSSNDPKILFSLSPEMTDFNRMGQIWSKPVKAKIRQTAGANDKGTDVLIFGGGYDTCYENEAFQVGASSAEKDALKDAGGNSCNKTEAQGNAIYMIDAKEGDLIWSASASSGAKTDVDDMTNSVVAGVKTLDRNNDGYMDHLYFADLGGQVFRADFVNAGFKGYENFENKRVVKVLDSSPTGSDLAGKYALRFYESPVISFYRDKKNKLYALINIISGDRSSPLSKMRKDLKYADRLYGIMDFEVTKGSDVFYDASYTPPSALIDANLYGLPKSIGTSGEYSKTEKQVIVDGLENGSKKGWYYPLIRFDGWNNVLYTKGVGKSEIMSGYLFTTTYNPDMKYGEAEGCSAEIMGGSERELYCLPYGICMDDTSKNGRGGFIRAGRGIQELTLGPRGSGDKGNQRTLIGTRTLKEQSTPENRIDFGDDTDGKKETELVKTQKGEGNSGISTIGGDGTAPPIIAERRYVFTPKTWYEANED